MAELDKYRKKVADQQKEIDKLKTAIEGQEQLQQISYAYIAELLKLLGAKSADTAVSLDRQRVAAAVNGCRVYCVPGTDNAFGLYAVEGEGNGKGEDSKSS